MSWRRSRSPDPTLPDQLVVVGEHWDHGLRSLASLLPSRWCPMILFASLTEAALYSSVALLPSVSLSSEAKITSLLQVTNCESSLALCCRPEAAPSLLASLQEAGVQVTSLPDNVVLAGEVLSSWARRGGLLLVPDHQLSLLPCPLAGAPSTLVHWDLPSLSRKLFSLRLQLLLPAMKEGRSGLRMHLLLGPQDQGRPLVALLPWLARFQPLPPTLQAASLTSPQCWVLAEQGECRLPRCQQSHGGLEEVRVARGQELQFQVLEVRGTEQDRQQVMLELPGGVSSHLLGQTAGGGWSSEWSPAVSQVSRLE